MSAEWGTTTSVRIGEHDLDMDELTVGDVVFDVCPVAVRASTADRFSLAKSRDMVEHLATMVAELPARVVVELGVYQGGSTAFLALQPAVETLVAFDLDDPAGVRRALAEFVDANGLGDRVRLRFGVDQADAVTVLGELDEHGITSIDLVVDDASHLYGPTVASFDALFPRVRPGGYYVIEDWRSDIQREFQLGPQFLPGTNRPLATLVFELLLACGQDPGVVERVDVDRHMVVVTRGSDPVEPEGFALASLYDERNAELLGDWRAR